MAVRVSGEDHAPQILSLCRQEWSDPCRRPEGEKQLELENGTEPVDEFIFISVIMSVVQMLLVGTGFTPQTEEQYFQFLAKFEIALPVASNR